MRVGEVATRLTKMLVEQYFRREGQDPPYYLFGRIQPITRRWLKECLILKGGTTIGMAAYAEIAERAAALIYKAVVHEAGANGAPIVKAMLDPYNPHGSTDRVSFMTTKTNLWSTAADKCHVNFVVCDSNLERVFARVVEAHPATISYVKNQALGFEVPYLDGSVSRKYLPDFIVRLDDGRGPEDPLNLVIEIKGVKNLTAQVKAETMRALWVPGVNNLGSFGRWSFGEFRDGLAIERDYEELVQGLLARSRQAIPIKEIA
jgi:type III restriction enzyme